MRAGAPDSVLLESRFRANRRPLSSKSNPPYPPLSGGQEKAKPPQPGGGASPFYTPLTRGGRGGCFCSGQAPAPVRGRDLSLQNHGVFVAVPRTRMSTRFHDDRLRTGEHTVGHICPNPTKSFPLENRVSPPSPVGFVPRITKSGVFPQPRFAIICRAR